MRGLGFFLLGLMIFGLSAFDLGGDDVDVKSILKEYKEESASEKKGGDALDNIRNLGWIKGKVNGKTVETRHTFNVPKESYFDIQRIKPKVKMVRYLEPNQSVLGTAYWAITLYGDLTDLSVPHTFAGPKVSIEYGNADVLQQPYSNISRLRNTSLTITRMENRKIKGHFSGVLYGKNDSLVVEQGEFLVRLITR